MSQITETFNNLLTLAVENGASDIHIKSFKPALLRLHGRLEPVDMEPLEGNTVHAFIQESCPREFFDRWREHHQIDYSYSVNGVGRFRVSAFTQRGTPSIVFRHVKDKPPAFKDLNLNPDPFLRVCDLPDGIVLICGATGSGKSSSLAAMLNYMNNNFDYHVVTLEDPIEFTYTDVKCSFNQREIGLDTPTFGMGMRAVLRQDPDVILVGEMRDKETFDTAMSAAETGHLVFGTLHSANAQQAVQRLFEFYPPEQHQAIRHQLSSTLRATISQKLLPSLEGDSRLPCLEIFIVDALGRKVLEEGAYEKIGAVIESSKGNGSQTFNQDLFRLVKAGLITKETAMENSPNPRALEMNLKGIFISTGQLV